MSRGSITDNVIKSVDNISKKGMDSIMEELRVAEPSLYKWIKQSVKDDVSNMTFHGVTIHSPDAVKHIGGILVQAKVEAYLMARLSQDREWNALNGIEDEDLDVPHIHSIQAFSEGKLDDSHYKRLKTTMSAKEKKDKNHWKNKILKRWENQKSGKVEEDEIKQHLKKTSNKDKGKPDGGVDLAV